MIKVNDYKTVEKMVSLMHYHKDWKVRKKNWKRYMKTLTTLWDVGLVEFVTLSKRDRLTFHKNIVDLNVFQNGRIPKDFTFTGVKLVRDSEDNNE